MKSNEPAGPRIRRAPLQQLSIYEISESELEEIEKGGPESLFLNFSIFFISSAISLSITLFTTDISPDKKYYTFLTITLVSWVSGIVLGMLWIRSHRSKARLIGIIRSRMPPDGDQIAG